MLRITSPGVLPKGTYEAVQFCSIYWTKEDTQAGAGMLETLHIRVASTPGNNRPPTTPHPSRPVVWLVWLHMQVYDKGIMHNSPVSSLLSSWEIMGELSWIGLRPYGRWSAGLSFHLRLILVLFLSMKRLGGRSIVPMVSGYFVRWSCCTFAFRAWAWQAHHTTKRREERERKEGLHA